MGVYVFKTDVLLKLLTSKYPSCNDFGSEIIPSAVKDHNVQVIQNIILTVAPLLQLSPTTTFYGYFSAGIFV